jgi:uncharacterized repeat protein (TIGR03803 family)
MLKQPTASLSLRAACALTLGLAGLGSAQAYDTYAGGLLSIPTLQVGPVTYSDVVVQVGAIVTPPNGISANGNIDTYSPLNNQVTVPTVIFNGGIYYNVVATVKSLVSIGGVSGADTYAGGQLTLPAVQIGGAIYTDVVVTVGTIVSHGGGMPQSTLDTYAPSSQQLSMAAVQVGSTVFTNAVITPGHIVSVGGQLPVETGSYVFGGYATQGSADGAAPQAALLVGSDGNLYGTTSDGGTGGNGTVFRLTPGGVETVIHTFGGTADGANPYAALMEDSQGNFYGTTAAGGANGSGAIFRIDAAGTESLVYSFGASPTDGTSPYGGLIQDAGGNLWGTTTAGGVNGVGTVFSVNPSTGAETVLYSFTGINDGSSPYGGLTAGADGNFYGTTSTGGPSATGTVFRVSPTVAGGAFATLYSFGSSGADDGSIPESALTLGRDGNLYGTTFSGGQYGAGTVFAVTPAGVETVIHSFSGGGYVAGSNDGANPYAGLTLGSDGNFYGTTVNGGIYDSGAVFKLTPGAAGAGASLLLLYSFTGDAGEGAAIGGSLDGASPYGALVETANGDFYGTTVAGGSETGGVVFRLTEALTAH